MTEELKSAEKIAKNESEWMDEKKAKWSDLKRDIQEIDFLRWLIDDWPIIIRSPLYHYDQWS